MKKVRTKVQFPSILRRCVEWCLRVILQGIDVCQADGKGWRNYSEEDSDVEICCCLHRKAGKFLNVNRNVECVSDEMKELKYVFSKRSHRKLLSAFVEVVASTTTSIKSRMKLLSFSWSENQIGIFFCDICRCRQFFYFFYCLHVLSNENWVVCAVWWIEAHLEAENLSLENFIIESNWRRPLVDAHPNLKSEWRTKHCIVESVCRPAFVVGSPAPERQAKRELNEFSICV